MTTNTKSVFEAVLKCPAEHDDEFKWAFVVLPMDVSAKLPRRGRTSVIGSMNCEKFSTQLEPDGKKSHWLKVSKNLLGKTKTTCGDLVSFEIEAVSKEPEPEVPADFNEALQGSPSAKTVWDTTTTLARVDWIHWIETAKQQKTRKKRINDACDMLASGKKRVCCFDPSGFYSKALNAPEAR